MAKPSGFYGSPARTAIGLVTNPGEFDHSPDKRIDFFMPGSHEERWVVGYKISGTAYKGSNAARMNVTDISDNTVTDTSSVNTLSAYSVGTFNSVLKVEQTYQFDVNDAFFKTTVILTNTSGGSIDSVRYMRTFDPDNTSDQGGATSTRNEVQYTYAADGKAVVEARTSSDSDPVYTATGSQAPILFYSTDSRAVTSTFGFSNNDPYAALAYDSPRAKNSVLTGDNAITIAFDVGTLAAASSSTFVYYTSLDSRDFNTVISAISGTSATPTPTTTPVIHTAVTPPVCSDTKPLGVPDLYQIDTTQNNAALYFTPVPDQATYYYAAYGYTPEAKEFGVKIDLPDAHGAQKYTINKLEKNIEYYFKLRAGNGCATGEWSPPFKAKTSSNTVAYYKNTNSLFSLSGARAVLGTRTTAPEQSNSNTSCDYTVQAGDSLWSISAKFLGKGSAYATLRSKNTSNYPTLHESTRLRTGWTLNTCT